MRNKTTSEIVIPVPTLSQQGMVLSTGEKLDRLLSYYFTTDTNQSNIFKGETISFQETVANYQRQPTLLCEQMKTELTSYLERYFTLVTVMVDYKDLKEGIDDGPYELIIDAMVGDSFDDQQRLFKNARMEDGVLTAIFTYNNTGNLLKHELTKTKTKTRL